MPRAASSIVREKQAIVSLISSATEMVGALGALDLLVGRSHECDYPPSVRALPACTRALIDVDAAHGADVALHLGQDVGRLQPLKHMVENFVNGKRTASRVFNLLVNGAAIGVDIDQGTRTSGQRANRRRIVTFM